MVVLLALLWLPGFILTTLLGMPQETPLNNGEKSVSSSVGLFSDAGILRGFLLYPPISMGLLTLLYLWTTTLGLTLTPELLRVLLIGLVLSAVWLAWKKQSPISSHQSAEAVTQPSTLNLQHSTFSSSFILHSSSLIFLLCFLALLLMLIETRWAHMSQLAVPAWVDSLHHALLIRVTAERGQIPLSLTPYLPVERLAYHWGMHVLSAASLVISNVSMPLQLPEAMLWHSFLLQVLTALACAGLATALWRHRLAGLTALAIIGLGSIMPAFYLSWGRTTLLTGMLLLPGMLLLSYQLVCKPGWRIAILLALAMSGLSLTHLPTFVFGLAWCVVVWGLCSRRWLRSGVVLGTSLILTALAQLPWLIILLTRARPGTGSSALHVAGNSSYNALSTGLLWAIGNDLLLALATAAALLGILRRKHITLLILLWCGLATLLANPVLIGLPYLSFVTNEIMVASLFLPASLLIGGAVVILAESIQRRWSGLRHSQSIVALIILAWAIWRLAAFQSVVNPNTIISSADDIAAVRWAASGTPADARFLVNTTGWLGPVDRGSDGGWWLLPIAGRQVSTPPVLYNYAPDDSVTQIQADTAWLRKAGEVDDLSIATFMWEHGYTHVFATQQGTTLNRERLRNSPFFEEIYANSSVSILRLRER